MNRILCRAVCVAIFCPFFNAIAIDLTPRYVVEANNGVRSQRAYFIDGDKKYAVTLDSETKLMPGEGSAVFNFIKFQRAVMRLSQSPVQPSLAFEAVNLSVYRKTAERLLPEGAIHSAIISEDSDVLPINRWHSTRITFEYEFTGVLMRESVVFLNLNSASQIVVQIRAGMPDFTAVSARGLSILQRWHEVTPDMESGGT